MKANEAVTLHTSLAEVDSALSEATQAFARLPAVFGADMDPLMALQERNEVLANLSRSLWSAREELKEVLSRLHEMHEATERQERSDHG